MTPIVVTQSIDSSLLVESTPFGYGFANIYRGAEIISTIAPATPDISTVDIQAHPYRNMPAQTQVQSYVPVLVRIFRNLSASTGYYQQEIFQRATIDRFRMANGSSPRLHRVLGRDSRVLISAEDYLVGTPLRAILDAHTLRNERFPESHALALGETLIAFWSSAAHENIQTNVELDEVLIDEQGQLRMRPTYHEERSRQDVGAALLSFVDDAAMSSPEEIQGLSYDVRSSMFYLGLLLYELLSGTHPHHQGEKKLFELLARMSRLDAPYLRTRRPEVHPAVAAFVHCCLERDLQNRFSDWNELRSAYRGIQALFAPVGPAALLKFAHQWVPEHRERHVPPIIVSDVIQPFTQERIESIDIAQLSIQKRPTRVSARITVPVVDEQAEFAGTDGRPMLRVSPSLLVDARPVTKAELERYYFAKGQVFPAELRALNDDDDDTCVFVTPQIATAYAAWAGKRLPTEIEWELAIEKFGGERFDVGRIWEWTNTPHEHGGWVVRGGRWRDQSGQTARPENRSFARKAAPDLGFRCVLTLDDPAVEIPLDSKE